MRKAEPIKKKNEEIFISHNYIMTVSVCFCTKLMNEEGRMLCAPGNGQPRRHFLADRVMCDSRRSQRVLPVKERLLNM